jgi:NADH:ubiquinone oxidoreductase subunit H
VFIESNILSNLLLVDLVKIICLLIAIAYYTLAERKIMAAIQRRKGPNVVGFYGLLQPLADGLKLLSKELLIPTTANSRIFLFAPFLILVLSLVSWAVIPFGLSETTFESKPYLNPIRQLYLDEFLKNFIEPDLREYDEAVELVFNF